MSGRDDAMAVPTGGLTRRRFLRGVAAGGLALAGGGALAACERDAAGPGEDGVETIDVTLLTAGWPFEPMPSPEAQEDSPASAAYAEALQNWMEENPGAELQEISFDVWSQEDLVTGVAGGTAPAMYPASVLGGWSRPVVKSAFLQDMAADVTDLVEEYGIIGQTPDYVLPVYEAWMAGGRHYGVPDHFHVGTGFFFRRDLLEELGHPEPQPGWTWDDVRAMAAALTDGERRKGAVFQVWGGIGNALGSQRHGLLTKLPAPEESWNWRWDHTSRSELWAPAIERYRAMMWEDESILADIAFGDSDVAAAFARGDGAMFVNYVGSVIGHADGDILLLEDELDRPLDDIVGWIQQPYGDHGSMGTTQRQLDLTASNPDLGDVELDRAVSLMAYMRYGEGYLIVQRGNYEAWDGDARRLFTQHTPFNGITEIDGIGSVDDAWGPRYMEAIYTAREIPLVPTEDMHIPIEETTGPGPEAWNDMLSRWAFEPGAMDIESDLASVEQIQNQQAAGFSSTVPPDEFRAGARDYYAALDELFADYTPDWHAQVYRPWYEEVVQPALDD